MNPNNYAKLEASKRLVDAGIVLDTEFYHWFVDGVYQGGDDLFRKDVMEAYKAEEAAGDSNAEGFTFVPAPSMAEVWMELPATIPGRGLYAPMKLRKAGDGKTWGSYFRYGSQIIDSIKADTNPTDALIDLLIWVRKEASHES